MVLTSSIRWRAPCVFILGVWPLKKVRQKARCYKMSAAAAVDAASGLAEMMRD